MYGVNKGTCNMYTPGNYITVVVFDDVMPLCTDSWFTQQCTELHLEILLCRRGGGGGRIEY